MSTAARKSAKCNSATIWQVTERLTWSRGWTNVTGFMPRAAVAEAAAHQYLQDHSDVQVTDETDGPSRPLLYRLVQ